MKIDISKSLRFPKSNKIIFVIISAVFVSLATPTAIAQEEAEPKKLQRLYKCLDKKIFRLSKKKKTSTADDILKRCDKKLNKWLALLPEEAHDMFMMQLTESVTLALEDAAKGRFVADEDSDGE